MMLTGFTYQRKQQQQQYEAQATSSSTSTSLPPQPLTAAAAAAAAAAAGPLLHVTYAHRRWLWDEMARTAQLWTRGLILFIPVWNPLFTRFLHQWRHRCYRLLSYYSRPPSTTRKNIVSGKEEEQESSAIGRHGDDSNMEPQQQQQPCPICHAQPITVPVSTDCCGHAYCYACLYQESLISGLHQVTCRICGRSISLCKRM
jgi:hypothetical protein